MIELGQILEGLVQRTGEGRLKWRQSVENTRFVTAVDTIAVVIQQIRDGDLYHPDIRERDIYRLDIYDESGEIIESLSYLDTSREQNEQMARLYMMARRQALNADATLAKLAKGLEL